MLLADLARTSREIAATRARSRKIELIARCLRAAARPEVEATVAYLSGELLQRRTGIGWASLRDLPPPAQAPTLTVAEVDAVFARLAALAGHGSQTGRRRGLHELFARATTEEQRFLAGLVAGELRQGALEGLMVDAVARAAEIPVAQVRRAAMVRGALGTVAAAALAHGEAGLAGFRLEVGRPVQPMLAQTADSVATAFERLDESAVEWKLDGVRIQVHRAGPEARVFTRTLDDVTNRVPEVVEAALALPVDAVVLDGEVIALDGQGRPRPFQHTASRVASRTPREAVPLTPYVFDLLHLDGEDLLARDGRERYDAMAGALPPSLLVPRLATSDPTEAQEFLDDALARGHEGVVVKSVRAPYEAGRRGGGWVKVKPRHTLDLVVLAAEWGHGRRRGWLSNLHLGARDPTRGGFVMLGKTFKGLTDAMLDWQTTRLLALEIGRDAETVHVRPELVVEVAFDGVQTSPRYPGGMALRFARVLRHRPDKRAGEADTVDTVRAIHQGQPAE